MLLAGTLSTFADVDRPSKGPKDGTKVGNLLVDNNGNAGVVVYKVTGWDAKYKDANGEEIGAYQVQITGLNWTGVQTKPKDLVVQTAFQEQYGEEMCNYYVTSIIDVQDTNPSDPKENFKAGFYAMTNLETLEFKIVDSKFKIWPDKTFSIGDYAFFGCENLETITLPANVGSIGAYAYQNTAVKSFEIPQYCGTIKPYAFYNSTNLKDVTVAENNYALETLSGKVFANSAVKNLNLSNAKALTTIGSASESPFLYNLSEVNNQLTSVTLPASVTTINKSFAHCTALTEIVGLENTNITEIVDKAFENCSSLPVLNFPKGAAGKVLLTGTPFVGCKKLTNLTFANGFLGTIGDGSNLYGTANLDVLEKITFNGDMFGVIAAKSFVGSTKLGEVEFKGALGKSATINAAFTDVESLTKLTFSGEYSIKTNWNDAATPAVVIAKDAFNGTKIAALDFKKIQVELGSAIINDAFASSELATVTFGDIKLGNAEVTTAPKEDATVGTLTLKDNAFVSPKLTKAVFGAITADNGASIFTFGDGAYPVFNSLISGKDYALKTVKIAEDGTIKGGAGTNTIAAYAFKSNSLETVTIGNLAGLTNATYSIGESAFAGAEVNAKTVTIGNISKKTTIEANAFKGTKLTTVKIGNISNKVTIGDNAFFGDELATVEIAKNGSISDDLTIGSTDDDASTAPFGGDKAEKSIVIGTISGGTTEIKDYAFSGKLLKSVKIGNIGVGDADNVSAKGVVTIGKYAFANTTTASDAATIEKETVEIGYLNPEGLTIEKGTFQRPAKGGEAFEVTIGKICKNAVITSIAADAFGTKDAVGTTKYTLGDVLASVSNIATGAFRGSVSADATPVNTTSVITGDLNFGFQNFAFDKVYDVETEKWNIAGNLIYFSGVVDATIGDIPAGKSICGNYSTDLVNLTFKGGVADANAIGATALFASEKVRNIKFASDDPVVAIGAFSEGAFKKTGDALAAASGDDKLTVVYRVATAANSNQIFNSKAFGATNDKPVVVLYTDAWSKKNKFQHYIDNTGVINRLSLSDSETAPGDPIIASCRTGANGKYAYGRLYVPAGTGMKYVVDAKVEEGANGVKTNGINLFYATLDQPTQKGATIYMKQLTVYEGKYWIDATEVPQTFIVRTNEVGAAAGDKVEVKAVEATDAIIAEAEPEARDWFGKALADYNDLKYATNTIKNQELQDFAEFKNHGIYVMANPSKNNLQFAILNQYDPQEFNLSKGSVYVLSRKGNIYDNAPVLNIVWEEGVDEENYTGISSVKTTAEDNDAIYNLQGVRVNKAQKGLYIQNGKKYVVK